VARVLVAGCGYVGTAVAQSLVTAGHVVFGLRRRVASLPPDVTPVPADLTDASTLSKLPRGIDVVFYTAAAAGFGEAAYRDAYVRGPANLLAALDIAGDRPSRLLFTSSTSVYAQTDGDWVHEGSPTRPEHITGQLLLEGETFLRQSPVPTVILRLGGIYGPGRTRFIDSVRSGSARRWSGDPVWTNRIHRDDCAGALAHLMSVPAPAPIYVGVDREPAPRNEVLAWLAAQVDVPEPTWEEPTGAASSRAMRSNKRCSSRLLQETGFPFTYPSYREGYGAMLAE